MNGRDRGKQCMKATEKALCCGMHLEERGGGGGGDRGPPWSLMAAHDT